MITQGLFDSQAGYLSAQVIADTPPSSAFMREYYRLLRAYYNNNGLYDIINQEMEATRITNKDMKPLRNPANRTVEFYAAKLWPGVLPDALPIITEDNDDIIPLIHQVWQWSNLTAVKQRAARWFATYGDFFIKVATRADQTGKVTAVYEQIIKPEYVTDFDMDERGFITYIRVDIPQQKRKPDGSTEPAYHTEIWDKVSQIWRVWHHKMGLDASVNRLDGSLVADGTFEESFGADFVPFVYQPFRDDGSGRGLGAFSAQLDKIDEANRQATRLAQILFRYNKAVWALLANGVDQAGRPLPPPSIDGITNGDGELEFDDDMLLKLPGTSQLQSLVPQIDYSAALAVLQDQMKELENDLPELAYYKLREMNTVSGRAVSMMLGDAIDRLLEARGNGEAAWIRAQQMALTIGVNTGLFPDTIGTFENGDFNHHFAERPVIQPDDAEIATTAKTWTDAGAGLEQAAVAAGMPEAEAQALAQADVIPPTER